MRLTLRTLLAWLDGVLGADEQRLLGDRVAASTMATGLAQRILISVARRDLDAARIESWGTPDDLNFVADYLDNRLAPEQLEWFERSCLQSEQRLAEVADCHGGLAELSRCGEDDGAVSEPTRAALKLLARRAAAAGRSSGSPAPPDRFAQPVATTSSPAAMDVSAAECVPTELMETMRSERSSRRVTGQSMAPASSHRQGEHPAPVARTADPDHRSSTTSPPLPGPSKTRRKAAGRDLDDRRSALVAALLALFLLGGAVAWMNFGGRHVGPPRAAIQGFVTCDGIPVDDGLVVLTPAEGTKGPSAGSALIKGHFSIAAAAGPVTGRYRVEITARRKTGNQVKPVVAIGRLSETSEMEQFIPAKYNNDSEIEIDVKPGRNTISLELKSEPKPAAKTNAQSKPPRIMAGRDRLPGGGVPGGRPG